MLSQELPGSVFAHWVLCSQDISWSAQSAASGSTSHSEYMREADQLRKLMCGFARDLYRVKKDSQTLNSLIPKAPEGCSEKGVLAEIQFASKKGKWWGQKCPLSKSLAITKLRGEANRTRRATGTLMNLNRKLTKFGKERDKALHPGRITPSQSLLWGDWACSTSQADHVPQHTQAANMGRRYQTPSGAWSAGKKGRYSFFQAAPEILWSATRAEPWELRRSLTKGAC